MKVKQIIVLVLMGTLFFIILYIFSSRQIDNMRGEIPVSLPEEISEARKGDTLYVTEVSDSIYVGFRKY